LKIGRFKREKDVFFGIIKGREVATLKETRVSQLKETRTIDEEKIYDIKELKFLPPTRATKIVAVGLNYKAHAEEMGKPLPEEPLLFMKPSTSIISNKMKIILPQMSEKVDYEGEVAIVIGKKTKNVSEEEAKDVILGYSCFNDVTARDLQKKDGQYTRAKSFDTFAPYGPWIQTEADPLSLKITTKVNGEVKQRGNTSDMIFSPFFLVSFISKIMTLLPGDVIITGTPPGVGTLKEGDKVEIEIEEIGTLINYVKKEQR